MNDDLTDKVCIPCQGGIPALSIDAATLLLKKTPGWSLKGNGSKLYRSFKFDNFEMALAFVNKIGALAEKEGHHPDLEFGWGYVNTVVYTHKINGLHENDFILAAKINAIK